MGIGVGVGETLLGASQGNRASDPFGSKDDRGMNQQVFTQSANLANSLENLGLESTKSARNKLLQVLQALPDVNEQIDINSIAANPAFGAIKAAVEGQFRNAQDNLVASSAPGGALSSSLGGLERDRAGALAQGIGGLAVNEADRRLRALLGVTGQLGAMGSAATGQSAGLLGGLGQQQAQIASANIYGDASNKNAKVGFQGDQFENASSSAGMMAGGK